MVREHIPQNGGDHQTVHIATVSDPEIAQERGAHTMCRLTQE
jgi:hypothetical protein